MHDKTINRTMSGKGLVEDYTLAELKAMRLKNGDADSISRVQDCRLLNNHF